MHGASATLFAAFNPPHRISASKLDGSAQTVLGYNVELLRGRSIKVFMGPKTDSTKLSAALKSAALNNAVTAEMDLYDISGTCQRVTLTFTPFSAGAFPTACRICIIQKSHSIEQGQFTDTAPAKPRVALPAIPRDAVPSPYIRRFCNQELPDIPAVQHPSMRPIIWRRIGSIPK
jgi:hypothetical protein